MELLKAEIFKNIDPVSKWMTKEVICINENELVSEAIAILDNTTIFGIPVVDKNNHFLGLMSKTVVMNNIANAAVFLLPVSQIMLKECEVVSPSTSIDEASQLQGGCLPVVDEEGILVGIMTRTDIIRANASRLDKAKEQLDYAETLKIVLNSAYEGVVVVNQDGNIQEINEAYCRILNCRPEDVIGCPAVDIIENTRLDIVAKTGIEERGHIQRIGGMDLVVHRIPIVRNQKPVGAIGMLVFKDVSEMNVIYQRHSSKNNQNEQQKDFENQQNQDILNRIIGQSPAMLAAKKRALKAANCSSNVVIRGSSGTGKEIFARAIHNMSAFSQGRFVSVNCAAIPENLLESELFGYAEGAFTDAKRGGKIGKFELAEDGTIFLDEIGDMTFSLQAKLLRVIQERTIERVGSTEQKRINIRIITATHRNLEAMVAQGTFREDLYYRIHVIPLYLPDLAERTTDVPIFLTKYISSFSRELGFELKRLSGRAEACLNHYNWPGNVRQLMNVCEALVALSEGPVIEFSELPQQIQLYQKETSETTEWGPLEQKEKELISNLLKTQAGNKAAVARELNISRSTLYEKIKRYELT